MRATRLHIPDISLASGGLVPLHEDQAHYLLRVLRQEHGHPVILFNAESGAWQGSLIVTGKKASVMLDTQIQPPVTLSDIWLLAAPIKKEPWDFVIEKATELGIAALQPVITAFTQNSRINDQRIRANLVEAAQQCERTDIPELRPAAKLESLLKNWDGDRLLYVALERSDARPALEVFDKTRPGAILIGPEGGFSDAEKQLFTRYDFIRPVTLGPLILRAETAALTGLALWSAK